MSGVGQIIDYPPIDAIVGPDVIRGKSPEQVRSAQLHLARSPIRSA